ncbi:MAG: hypothetical protein IKC47_00870 [Clostridia bacterium]|nr:hypothetical protein [Clostridia bacterium]
MLIPITQNDDLITQNRHDKRFLNIVGLIKNGTNVKLYTDGNGSVALVENNHTVCFVTQSTSFVDEVVATLCGEISFCGISNEILQHLQSIYQLDWVTLCSLYAYNGLHFDDTATQSLDFRPMDARYWQLISDGTPYHADEQDIRECLGNRLSSAIYIDNEPVCWCLLHHENSLGMLYTLPQHRRKGYALAVMTDICKKIVANGDVPYGYIIKGNYASEQLAKHYNLDYLFDAHWCGMQK